MRKVFVDVGISLDGFLAGPNRGPENPLGDRGAQIHAWMFRQRRFRESLGLGAGGETGADDDLVARAFDRIGANIMGKRMFEEGEANWPEEAPFRTPVFVLTRERRDPWERKGGTTFHFTGERIEAVLDRARAAAGEKDVRISGGADVIRQFLDAGLVDELTLHVAPVLLRDGVRLFERIGASRFTLEIAETIASPLVTHVTYAVKRA